MDCGQALHSDKVITDVLEGLQGLKQFVVQEALLLILRKFGIVLMIHSHHKHGIINIDDKRHK
jgi:hypothetical protein